MFAVEIRAHQLADGRYTIPARRVKLPAANEAHARLLAVSEAAGEELLEQAELDGVVDLEDVDRAAALEQLHREPDDDQPTWRAP
jgi:hypothetical protein